MRVFRFVVRLLAGGRRTRSPRPVMPGVWINDEHEDKIPDRLLRWQVELARQTPSIEEVD